MNRTRSRVRRLTLLIGAILSFCAVTHACELRSRAGPLDLSTATLGDLSRALAQGKVSSELLVRRYLARIARCDAKLNSIIAVNPNALAEAKRLDMERLAGRARGPLHGLPIV